MVCKTWDEVRELYNSSLSPKKRLKSHGYLWAYLDGTENEVIQNKLKKLKS